ncbi:HAD family acid phosphatase, partial [Shigella boydii]
GNGSHASTLKSPSYTKSVSWQHYRLQDKNIRIFYGDSDNDITAARDVGARGIRILRASNSTYKPLPQAGAFGEEVIVNSEY